MTSTVTEAHAWHFRDKRPVRARLSQGIVQQLQPTEQTPPVNQWIVPSLCDLQVNGYAGTDFQQDNLSVDDLLLATRRLREHRCHQFLLTLITDRWDRLMGRLAHLRRLRSESPELMAGIAGWHIEGPFLASAPGYSGTHEPELMIDPTPEHIGELREVTGADPVLLTLAPERLGAVEAIARASSAGIRVSLGHTNAPAEVLREAVDAGASLFTHLGNGCAAELNRHDNILWRVLDIARLKVSLIPDQIHVSPQLFRLFHRAISSGNIFYITDAMSAAGAPPGRYRLGKLRLEVGTDEIVRQPGTPYLSGSALRATEGVRRAAEMLAEPWLDCWLRFSEIPRKIMGLPPGDEILVNPAEEGYS